MCVCVRRVFWCLCLIVWHTFGAFYGLTIKSADPPSPGASATCRYDDSCGLPQDLAMAIAIASAIAIGIPILFRILKTHKTQLVSSVLLKAAQLECNFHLAACAQICVCVRVCVPGCWGQRITHTPGMAATLKWKELADKLIRTAGNSLFEELRRQISESVTGIGFILTVPEV